MDEVANKNACDQLRGEIHACIRRYGLEANTTVYQILGVLEIVKIDLVEMLEQAQRKRE